MISLICRRKNQRIASKRQQKLRKDMFSDLRKDNATTSLPQGIIYQATLLKTWRQRPTHFRTTLKD